MAEWVDDFGTRLFNVHEDGECLGEFCTIHNPSNHSLCLAPQKWWYESIMMRICIHEIDHIDVDDINVMRREDGSWFCSDYCDGCCHSYTGDE